MKHIFSSFRPECAGNEEKTVSIDLQNKYFEFRQEIPIVFFQTNARCAKIFDHHIY